MCIYKKENGFTLVELAIALMVIGLLIGGVLKGQELIDNAKITRTIKDINDYNTATMIFYSSYGALSGDIKNPNRIPNCSDTACLEQGDQDRHIGPSIISYVMNLVDANNNREARRFWMHLAKAGMLSGTIDTSYTGTPNTQGVDFPKSPYDTFVLIAYLDPMTHLSDMFPFLNQVGNYFVLTDSTGFYSGVVNGIPEKSAAKIDMKIDDGMPLTGKVRSGMTGRCGGSGNTEYNMSSNLRGCALSMLADF